MGQQQLLLIILGVIIVGIAIAVGISMFSSSSVQANKDALVNDLNNLAADAYQYKIRPSTMGGGAGSYAAYNVPTKLASFTIHVCSCHPSSAGIVHQPARS